MNKPVIVITPGEPSGIGIDLCLTLANHSFAATLILIADPEVLRTRAKLLNIDVKINLVSLEQLKENHHFPVNHLNIIPHKLLVKSTAGKLDPNNSKYVLRTLDTAIEACQQKLADALVTGPIHKGIINQAGINFTGHTEYLEQKTKTNAVMMLQIPQLKIALATTHLPLSEVSKAITREHLYSICHTLITSLTTDFNIKKPIISVCGLNPHAGENGFIGREEIEVISPTLKKLQAEGFSVLGPYSADTLFIEKNLTRYDAVLSMFHDQGLPVLKTLGFGKAVNITLGLPFIRTSVDHGTALEYAGTGKANNNSLLYAIDTAITMASNRNVQKLNDTNSLCEMNE